MSTAVIAMGGRTAREAPAPLLTRRGRMAVAVLSLGLMVIGFRIGAASAEERLIPTETVVVTSGDTLWSIAEARLGGAGDVRDLVHEIRQINGLDTSELAPGDVLEVPRR